MNRTDVINAFIKARKYKSYLEIGIAGGSNFISIKCENKESCDPFVDKYEAKAPFDITYQVTSDEMFGSINDDKKWDIIFIDGLHSGNQVIKDVINSLKHLNSNGVIILHDSLPYCEAVSHFPRNKSGHWNGSVFKAYPIFKELGIDFKIIDTDNGLGIIEYQSISIDNYPEESKMTWNEIFSDRNFRNKFMNVISVNDAIEQYWK